MRDCRGNYRARRGQSGQILIEYILLLLIGLTIGNMLVKQLTAFSDEPDKQGIIIQRWISLWEEIGKDFPDKD